MCFSCCVDSDDYDCELCKTNGANFSFDCVYCEHCSMQMCLTCSNKMDLFEVEHDDECFRRTVFLKEQCPMCILVTWLKKIGLPKSDIHNTIDHYVKRDTCADSLKDHTKIYGIDDDGSPVVVDHSKVYKSIMHVEEENEELLLKVGNSTNHHLRDYNYKGIVKIGEPFNWEKFNWKSIYWSGT